MSRKTKLKPTEQLNEDMDKMFEGQASEDFSLDQLSSAADATASWTPGYSDESQVRDMSELRLREMDIDYHGSDSFPHMHHTLKPHHHRVRRKSHRTSDDAPPPYSSIENKEEADTGGAVSFEVGDPDLPEGWSVGKHVKKDTSKQLLTPRKDEEQPESDEDDEESSPLLGEDNKLKPCIRSPDSEPLAYIDDSSREEENHDLENKEVPRKRRSHRRRRDSVEDPSWRRHAGSEHELQTYASKALHEEVDYLKEHDLDDIASHRFEDPSAYRRPRVRARSSVSSIIHMNEAGNEKADRQQPMVKKSYDHSPHEIFVELDELRYSEGHLEWKETARWIKYEEDVEDVANRWGKPHIAFLNFHALFSLRKGLDTGMFDCVSFLAEW
ncbi:anion exchange protein 3-like isoform X2 [Penaeus chinensis]|uniref:anion exchange protein 3-like isoform X2 n=1 Tax=Penaeus chinensis TaxID=139456 RepID=UPI001FB7B14B|nr:anion exchange protein 3-like isoform X2 [Penaeus chinensis]